MIKKLIIEQEDKEEMLRWKTDRFENFMNKIEDLQEENEQEYVLSIDIAKEGSKDHSVMMQFRFVDGKYIYEGHEVI